MPEQPLHARGDVVRVIADAAFTAGDSVQVGTAGGPAALNDATNRMRSSFVKKAFSPPGGIVHGRTGQPGSVGGRNTGLTSRARNFH